MKYSIQQAANKIGIHPKTLRRWEEQKKFTPRRTLGNQRRFSDKDIEALKKIKAGDEVKLVYDKVLSLEQAAEKLKVSSDTIRRWTKQGKLNLTINDDLEPGYSQKELEAIASPLPLTDTDPVADNLVSSLPLPKTDLPQLEETISWLKTTKMQKVFAYGAMSALALSAGLIAYLSLIKPDFLANPSIEELNLTPEIEVSLPRTASFLDGHITIGTDTGDYSFLDQNANLYVKNLALIEGGIHTSSIQLIPSQQPENQIGRQYVDASTGNLMYFDGLEWISLNQGGSGDNPSLQDVYDSGETTVVAENQDFDITLGGIATGSATSLRLTLAGTQSAFKILGGAAQEILTINDDALYPVVISQPTQVLGNLYAPQLVDFDNLNYFIDPGNSNLSLSVAGNATIASTLTFSQNGEFLTNGTDNYLISSGGLGVGGSSHFGINSNGNANFRSGNFEDTLTATSTFDVNGQVYLGDGGDAITLYGSSITFTGFNNCSALETNGSGVLSCGTDDSSASNIYWTLTAGAIHTVNQTADVLIGGTSTTSAKFAFLNVNSGTPTASIAGQLVLSGGNRNIQSTAAQDLILGGGTTGNILLQPSQDNTNYFQFTSDLTDLTLATTDGSNLTINPAGTLYLQSSANSIDASGNLVLAGTTTLGTVTYTWPGSDGSNGYALTTNGAGTLSWTDQTTLGTNYWRISQGTISPVNDTLDFLIGNTASTSAKFAVLNIDSGTPTASVSAGTDGATFLTADGNLQTTALQALTLGGGDTGDIYFHSSANSLDSSGNLILAGNLTVPGTTTFNTVAYTWPGSDAATSGYVLSSDAAGTLSWVDVDAAASGTIYWSQADGALFPKNSTVDLLVGGQASTSAKFAVLNIDSGTPTASVSAGTDGAAFLTADGNLATTALQALTLGGGDTGDIYFHGSTYNLSTSGDLTLGGRITFENAAFIQNEVDGNLVLNEPTIQLVGATSLDFDSPILDLSTQTVAVTLNNAVDSLNFDSNTLSIDAANNKVGIGNIAPDGKLQVTGAVVGQALVIFDETGDQDILTASSSGTTRFRVATDGYIYSQRLVDLADDNYYIDPAASGSTPSIRIDGNIRSNGAFTIDSKDNSGVATDGNITINADAGTVIIGDGSGKLDAGTVDPPYTINGQKYATYLPSITGVKEETTGLITTNEYVEGVGYRFVIDFSKAPAASDLWLFAKTTDLKKQINQLVVLLSPAGTARAWYTLDTVNYKLNIYTSRPTQVSYRLTAPRFDAHKWANTRSGESTGFIINDSGEWLPNMAGTIIGNTSSPFSEVFDLLEAKTAKIGHLAVENLSVGGQTLTVFVTNLVNQILDARLALNPPGFVSPLIETERLATNYISPILPDHPITIDSDVSISGTLEAKTIKSSTLDALRDKIAKLAEDYRTQTATVAAEVKKDQSEDVIVQLLTPSASESALPDGRQANLTADNIEADAGFFSEYLAVLGSATITDLNIANVLTVNQNLLLTQNSLSTLNDTLYIQPSGQGAINFLSGIMTLDSTGKAYLNGDLTVVGNLSVNDTLIASQITPAAEQSLDIRIASESAVSIYNLIADEKVASIDASGSGSFSSLNLKASGTATISAGTNNALVATDQIGVNSQVIITFTNSYAPATKYWVSKDPDNHQFSVFVNYPVNNPTSLDWLIIN
jgi:DNA-binding transcriptional MerR regulator